MRYSGADGASWRAHLIAFGVFAIVVVAVATLLSGWAQTALVLFALVAYGVAVRVLDGRSPLPRPLSRLRTKT